MGEALFSLNAKWTGSVLAALDSKVKQSFATLKSETNQSSAILETKLEEQTFLHRSPQEAAGNLREAASRRGLNSKMPSDAGPREAACLYCDQMVERLQSLEAELRHHHLATVQLVEQRILALEDELGQQKKGYSMLVSQLNGQLDVQQKSGTKNEHVEAQAPPTAEAGQQSETKQIPYFSGWRQRSNAVPHNVQQLRCSPNGDGPRCVSTLAQQQQKSLRGLSTAPVTSRLLTEGSLIPAQPSNRFNACIDELANAASISSVQSMSI